MKTGLLTCLAATLPLAVTAQIDYDGGIYKQDFDTLRSDAVFTPYTNFPAGWTVASAFNSSSYVWTSVTNGFSNNYGKYCFSSATNDADKCIGLVIGSTGAAYLGARFRNTSGVTLTAFSLSYTAEQWRKGAVTSNDQTIPFSYSLGATNLASGTFVNVPALDMHSTNDGDGVAAAMNGNVAPNQQLVSGTVSGISWSPDQELWIRWSGVAYPFASAHALAVDNLSFRAVPELLISVDSGRIQCSWSTNYSGYNLQCGDTPATGTWEAVTNSTVVVGGEYRIELNAADIRRFFRLSRQ